MGLNRPRYAAGVCASVLLLPAFLLGGMDRASDAPDFDVTTGAATLSSPPSTWLNSSRIVDEPVDNARAASTASTTTIVRSPVRVSTSSTTSTTSVTSVTAVSTTTVARVAVTSTTAVAAPTTAVVRATTTTTSPPTTVLATTTTIARPLVALPALSPVGPAARYAHSERGVASWYNAPDRTCAHRTAPKGTVIKVTRTSTGESTTCEVADWGPADTSRVIDLSMDTFELLAYSSAGLIDVLIEY